MGAVNSCFIGRCITIKEAQENHLKLQIGHTIKKNHRHLSTTFLQLDDDFNSNEQQFECKSLVANSSRHTCMHVDRVNINFAEEEELMTLPGINRSRAKAIVTYRAKLGGFRQPEDLVLVPGMGGDHLTSILPEITVDCAIAPTETSSLHVCTTGAPLLSRCASFCTTHSLQPILKPVELNSANVFQLMKIPGLNQKHAEAIVAYRHQHVRFTSITDLLRVKGIDPIPLQSLRSHLVIKAASPRIKISKNHGTKDDDSDSRSNILERLSRLFSDSQLQLICDLSDSIIHHSSSKDDDQQNSLQMPVAPLSNECLRVACWNLEGLSHAKATNPGVREVFCRVLLHYNINLIVLQDVVDCDAVHTFVAELNQPQVPDIKRRSAAASSSSLRGHWSCEVCAEARCGAFVWNSKMTADGHLNLELLSSSLLQSQGIFAVQPFSGHFKVHHTLNRTSWDLFVVSLTFVTSCAEFKAASAVVDLVNYTLSNASRREHRTDDVVVEAAPPLLLIGNFNLPPNDLISLNHLQSNGLKPLLSEALSTANIWVNKAAQELLHDEMNGVICEGLSHSFIPTKDFGWGARISYSCPAWCDLRGPTSMYDENGISKDTAVRLNG